MSYYVEFLATCPADALHHLEHADLPKEARDHARRAVQAIEGSLHGVYVKLTGHMASLTHPGDNNTSATHEIREVRMVSAAPASAAEPTKTE